MRTAARGFWLVQLLIPSMAQGAMIDYSGTSERAREGDPFGVAVYGWAEGAQADSFSGRITLSGAAVEIVSTWQQPALNPYSDLDQNGHVRLWTTGALEIAGNSADVWNQTPPNGRTQDTMMFVYSVVYVVPLEPGTVTVDWESLDFFGLTEATAPGFSFDVVDRNTFNIIPEPSAALVFAVGLIVAAARAARTARASTSRHARGQSPRR